MVSVLFVCLGNICRSPTAEGIFLKQVKAKGLEKKIKVDSAGTSDYHSGELPDSRMRTHALARGYDLTSRARQLVAADLEHFDYILGMDDSNIAHIQALDPEEQFQSKIQKITDFALNIKADYVPDPYYGGTAGFERVIDLLEDACAGLLAEIEKSI